MDFLEEELEEILNIFREESEDQIQKLNQNLLKLEKNPKSKEVISELFREAHSIKGAARMIGLNDIQLLAHKLEDILGLAKDNTLSINAHIIDILCKTVDCISSITEESVRTKGTSHSPLVDDMIVQLENVKNCSTETPETIITTDKKEDDKSNEVAVENNDKKLLNEITSKIPIFINLFESLLADLADSSIILKLQKSIVEIDHLAETLSNEAIKESVFNTRSKLDSVVRGSGIILGIEVDDMVENLEYLLRNLNGMNKSLDINVPEFFISREIKNTTEEVKIINVPQQETKEHENELKQSIDFINSNIHFIVSQNDQEHSVLITVLEKLSLIIKAINNNQIKKIYLKIYEIVNDVKNSKNKPDKEIVEVIKQSAENTGNLYLFPEKFTDTDPDLLFQRLSILQQMLEISEQAGNELVNEVNKNSQEETAYPPLNSKNELQIQTEPTNEEFKTSETGAIKTLRVDTRKLDQLISQVGELIVAKIKTKEHLLEIEKINRAMEEWNREWNKAKKFVKHIDRKSVKENDFQNFMPQSKNIYSLIEETSNRISKFMNITNALYRTVQEDDARLELIVNDIEQMVKSIRVLPFATIFHMFPRMVRDISRSKGKKIELIVSGSETSADKKIIEEIKSPLTHIIRNAIDHGLETPEERILNGKNPIGKIFLSAYHLENSVLIEIIDDGKGIDLAKIKEKVLQKGLLTQSELEAMNEHQIMNIVFWPGFSTGDFVTDLSGRGVGLDVVQTKINQLNGKVSIKSKYGEGCKISIKLPVTMATVKSFLVSVNNQSFALPTSVIKTVSLVKTRDIFYKEGRKTIVAANKTVPLFRLSDILEMPNNADKEEERIIVAILQTEDVEVGFIIDKLIGEHEILQKNLSPPLLRVRNIAGVTSLGSGELCLILNVNDLVKSAFASRESSSKNTSAPVRTTQDDIKNNILVVDDSVTTRILERNILRTAGYNVTVAVNGLDALTKLSSASFDLIVSDVEMPEINGIELTKRLKKDELYKNIPVILVTSLSTEVNRREGLNAGAAAYITKGNFDQKELLCTVRKLLNRG